MDDYRIISEKLVRVLSHLQWIKQIPKQTDDKHFFPPHLYKLKWLSEVGNETLSILSIRKLLTYYVVALEMKNTKTKEVAS